MQKGENILADCIRIPNSELKLIDGNIVILHRFPNTKWIVHNGWYTYQCKQYNGWYLTSIPAGTVIPLSESDLMNLTVTSNNREDCNPSCPPYPGSGWDCPCPPPGPPGPPIPPPRPHRPDKVPERYYGGVNYRTGQLVYLNIGSIYQATLDFRSSWVFPTLEENLSADVQSGHLIKIPDKIDIDNINTTILNDQTRKYLISFQTAFGTDNPTTSQADNYLSQLGIQPNQNIYFKNTDSNSPTSGHVFTYYVLNGVFTLVDQTVDKSIDVDNKIDKSIAGASNTLVGSVDVKTEDNKIVITVNNVNVENGAITTDTTNISLSDIGGVDKNTFNDAINWKEGD